MVTRQHMIPEIKELDDAKKEVFAASLKALIGPELWDESTTSISIDGNQLTVHQSAAVHRQILQLTNKLNACLKLVQDPADSDARNALESHASRLRPNLQKPLELRGNGPILLTALLNEFQRQTGVTILVDWDSLMESGWTPQTVLPSEISEKTAETFLRELGRAMGLTVLPVGENLMLMTTFQQAADRPALEVYFCADVIADKINADQLMQLLANAMGVNLQNSPGLIITYDASCQCIIAKAPNSIHRQIESIMQRLRDIQKQ
jgi:hypothetical protein